MDAIAEEARFWRRIPALVFLCLLFAGACFLPCIDCGPEVRSSDPGFPSLDSDWHFGLAILLFGWSGSNNGVPWSANVFWLAGIFSLFFGRFRVAIVVGAIATLLGLTTWWARGYDTMLIGYYVWQVSLVLLPVVADCLVYDERVDQHTSTKAPTHA